MAKRLAPFKGTEPTPDPFLDALFMAETPDDVAKAVASKDKK